jgi:membrane protein
MSMRHVVGATTRRAFTIVKETITQFFEERAPKMAAALAFYTTFALAPLLIFAVAIAGLVFGQDAAQGKIVGQLEGLVGPAGASTIQDLIENARQPSSGGKLATIIGVVTLLVGATGVVVELQDSLDVIWGVGAKKGGLVSLLRKRLTSLAMVLGVGFLLLVSLILSTALTAIATIAADRMENPERVLGLADLVLSFFAIGVLFALIYRTVPDAEVRWRDVVWGAATASLLFAIGKFALSYYIAHSSIASTYGAAGSLVALLVWVYYSAQILFFGAELSQVVSVKRRPAAAFLRPPVPHPASSPRRA